MYKVFCKSKTIEVGSDMNQTTPLYIDTKKVKIFLFWTSAYNVDILNPFNPELQHKDGEIAIKNELIDLLSRLREF